MEKLLNNQKNRVAQIVFYIAFAMEILIRSINSIGVDLPYRTRLLQLAALLFCVKIVLTKYTRKEWLFIAATAVLTVIPFLAIRQTLWIEIAVMLIASKDMERKKCMQMYFGVLGITMILMAVLSGFGIHGEFVQIKDFDRGGVEARYCFGFSHPNVFYSNLLILISMGMFLFYNKIKVYHLLVLTVLNCLLMELSASRTGFIVVQVLIFAVYIILKWPRIMESKMVHGFGYVSIGLAAFLSYIIYFLDWELLEGINRITTGRLGLARGDAPITSWQLLPAIRESAVIDMGFIHVMYNWGIVFGIIYLFLIFWNYRQFIIKKDNVSIVILLAYTLFTMIEAHAFSMYFVGNVMFLLMIGWGKEPCNVSAKKSDS